MKSPLKELDDATTTISPFLVTCVEGRLSLPGPPYVFCQTIVPSGRRYNIQRSEPPTPKEPELATAIIFPPLSFCQRR